jgi:hypothetical protein
MHCLECVLKNIHLTRNLNLGRFKQRTTLLVRLLTILISPVVVLNKFKKSGRFICSMESFNENGYGNNKAFQA